MIQLNNIHEQKKLKQQTKAPEEQLYAFLQRHYKDSIPQSTQKKTTNLFCVDLKKLCIVKQLGTYKDLKKKQDMISKLIEFFTTVEKEKWNQNHMVEQPTNDDEHMSEANLEQQQQGSSSTLSASSYSFVEEE